MKKERIPGPFEAEATALCVQVWEACGEAPKPVLNGAGNPFIAARRIAEKFLEAGHKADAVSQAMWDCYSSGRVITVYNVTATLKRRSLDKKVVELYPGASQKTPPVQLDYQDHQQDQERLRELSERFRAR